MNILYIKRFKSFLLLMLVSRALFSQNYQPFNPDHENTVLCGKSVLTTKIQSSLVNAEEIKVYPYWIAYPTSNSDCNYLHTHSWMGYKVVFNSLNGNLRHYFNAYNFSNPKGDSIFFNLYASLNQTWIAMENDEITVGAILERVEEKDWLGLIDTFKTIKLYIIKKADHITTDWVENEVIFSKNYGVIEFPNLQDFPLIWRKCQVTGLSNPKIGDQKFNWRRVYSMLPGDELHTEYVSVDPPRVHRKYKIKKCLEVYEENEYIIHRKINEKIAEFDNGNGNGYHWQTNETEFEETIDVSSTLNTERIKFSPEGSIILTSVSQQEPGGPKRIASLPLERYNDNSACLRTTIDYDCLSFRGYTEDQGDQFFDCSDQFPYYVLYYLPVYRKRGDVEWGEKINFDSLKRLAVNPISTIPAKLYPNPVYDIFNIELPAMIPIEELLLIDVLGRRIAPSYTVNSQRIKVERQNLAPGLYSIFIRSGDSQKSYYCGKVIFY